jgi:hypothetical protein
VSIPIPVCLVSKALSDDAAYRELVERLKYNAKFGASGFWPCTHKPQCQQPSEEQLDALTRRLEADLA